MRVVQTLPLRGGGGARVAGRPPHGRRARGARIAAALFWIWPAYLVWRSTREYGFYGERARALALGLLARAAPLRAARRARPRAARPDARAGLWARRRCASSPCRRRCLAGVRRPRTLRDLPLVLGAASSARSPWLVWNVRNHWLFFHARRAGTPTRTGSWSSSPARSPPCGLRIPWSLDVGHGRGGRASADSRGDRVVVWLAIRRREERLEPLLAVALAFPLLYALSPYAWVVNEPRYLTLLAPVAGAPRRGATPTRRLRAATLVAATALTGAGLLSVYRHDLSRSYETASRSPPTYGPALRALERRHATRVLAPFWVAYRLDVREPQPRHRHLDDDHRSRSLRRPARPTSPHPACVFVAGEPRERRNRREPPPRRVQAARARRLGPLRLAAGGVTRVELRPSDPAACERRDGPPRPPRA